MLLRSLAISIVFLVVILIVVVISSFSLSFLIFNYRFVTFLFTFNESRALCIFFLSHLCHSCVFDDLSCPPFLFIFGSCFLRPFLRLVDLLPLLLLTRFRFYRLGLLPLS